MTLTPPEEPQKLFAEPPVRSDYARPGVSYAVRRAITVSVLLGLIGGGVYYIYGRVHSTVPQEIPTIHAEGPVKQKPEQPGGIDIPHQDVQVYQELDAKNDTKSQVEHLLPPPEAPQTSPQPAATPAPVKTETSQSPVANIPQVPKMESLLAPPPKIETTVTTSPQTPASKPMVVDVTPPAVAPTPAPAPAPAAVETLTPPPAKTVPVAPAPAVPAATVVPVIDTTKSSPPPVTSKAAAPVAGGPVVQLASVPDETSARRMLAELQTKYAAMLGTAKLHLVKADLGSKGIYYRIQSQRLTKEQADEICASLKKQNAGCIIVHP